MKRVVPMFEGEETESDRAEASSSDSDSAGDSRAPSRGGSSSSSAGNGSGQPKRGAKVSNDAESSDESDASGSSSDSEEEGYSSDESDRRHGKARGGPRVKEESRQLDDSESEAYDSETEDEDDDESGDERRVRVKREREADRVESSDEGEPEEVADDVMFKEQDAAAVDDDKDSDYSEEEEEEEDEDERRGEDEEAREELEYELEFGDDEDDGDSSDEDRKKPRRAYGFQPGRLPDPRRKGRELRTREVFEVFGVLKHVRNFVSAPESFAIRKGYSVTGPPIHDPLTPLQRLERKFRWPKHLRNVPKTDFTQDAVELIEDHDMPVTASRALQTAVGSNEPGTIAFAATPRPLMTSAVKALRHANRKRKRSNADGEGFKVDGTAPSPAPQDQTIPGDALVSLARASASFTDRYMESLLKANLTELQGIGEHDAYSQRSWTPLPVSRKPVANWRFVFEHLLMNRDARFEAPTDAFWPRMNDTTLQRIRDRIKSLNRATWQPEDDTLFDLMTRTGRQLGDAVDNSGMHSDHDSNPSVGE